MIVTWVSVSSAASRISRGASRPFNVVNDSHADLWGFVFSKDEKAAVRVAAERTPGVEPVTDNLRFMPSAQADSVGNY
jgi:osmotically-inducible protein OsmY